MTAIDGARFSKSSFSFYLGASNDHLIRSCSQAADGVVIAGRSGPGVVQQLRRNGWDGSAMFDGNGYKAVHPNPCGWLEAQQNAGADRILTPGVLAPWKQEDDQVLEAFVADEFDFADRHNATALVALDSRWLTKGIDQTTAAFASRKTPVAVVLSHRGDPLAANFAVDGLTSLIRANDDLTILRCDHGGIGALAFKARHASMGLTSGNRHLYPPGERGWAGKPNDRTVRLFSFELLDWFTAGTIAGWSASQVPVTCSLSCCDGQELARFLDDRRAEEAQNHNITALTYAADYVVNAPDEDRRRIWAGLCRDAIARYDRLGHLSIEPKAQLVGWAVWA